MDDVTDKQRLLMTCDDLRRVTCWPLAAGWELRFYTLGDEAHWLRIQTAADRLNSFIADSFEQQFGSDSVLLDNRQIYVQRSGEAPVGTVTAWFNDNFQGRCWGRVHWLAVLPECQGLGLGKALFSQACHRLLELGHERAYLSTSRLRPSAIRLYRQFGFRELLT